MLNAIFIVWRESVEALLVVGILYAWLRNGGYLRALPWLWGGVAAGVALAAALAGAMIFVQSELSGEALEVFQVVLLFVACALITQMVLWMKKHGRGMRRELEAGAARTAEGADWLGLAVLAAIAVAREGAETAVFLYGLGAGQTAGRALFLGALLGFAAALATAWAINCGVRFLGYAPFFRITGLVLLFLAAALLAAGVDRLIGQGWLPTLADPAWDTSAWLDDGGSLGAFLASFAGYRARPSLMLVLIYFGYWLLVGALGRLYARNKA